MVKRSVISIIIPCYNEEACLPELFKEIKTVCEINPKYTFEVIFINDGSTDSTEQVFNQITSAETNFRMFSFSRNFGHQIAITAGLDLARGDAIVFIDADLQDPPSLISDMINQWELGAEVVYAVRRSRSGESIFKLVTAKYFYRFLNWMSDVEIPFDTGDFRLLDRKIADVLTNMPEKHRFIRGMVAWVGYRQVALPYDRNERAAGQSKYPLKKMLQFAADGIFSFSSRPLEISTRLGAMAILLSCTGIIYAFLMRIFTSHWVEGWTALVITMLFLGGTQLLCLGMIGSYIGRIYQESKNRPLYVLRDNPNQHKNQQSIQKSDA